MWIFLAFLAVPLIEIGLFIKVGGTIGLGPTLAIVVITAVLGTTLVRREGARALEDLRRSLNELSDPSRPLAHGAMILVAGVLLLTPGFFTDALGLLLLIPGVRNWVMTRLASRVTVARFEMGGGPFPPGGADRRRPHDPDVIDAEEIDEITPRTPPRDGPSGWTRH
ncbi:FxsA family protein [Thioclava sp. 15-R06ZXC-3]|uniref:FxsA family protein n=1 Tax=Thioclava arctica TaxID=3238301 RepID=A0ABV3TI48_9RHOB